MLNKQKEEPADSPEEYDRSQLFTRTSIEPALAERYTEHGTTSIQTLIFAEEGQRQKVLNLLDNPALYDKWTLLLKYLFDLGCDPNGEKRYYAAAAIGELAGSQPFLDLKETVILPWAKSKTPEIRQTAAIALSFVIKHYETEIFALLKHWITLQNSSLNDAALKTYYRLVSLYADKELADKTPYVNKILEDAIDTVLKREETDFSYFQMLQNFIEGFFDYRFPTVNGVIKMIYDYHPQIAINYLAGWLEQDKRPNLRWRVGLLFLLIVRLDDASNEENRQKAVEAIYTLWEDPKIPRHQEIQEITQLKIEAWATEALEAAEDESLFEIYQTLFYDLYRKYEGQRRNRLEFHLRRFQKAKDREEARAKRRRKTEVQRPSQASFLDLIPV